METITKTVEREYVVLNGEHIRLAKLIDFLEEVEDAEPPFPMRYTTEYSQVADALIEEDIIGRTNRGSWFVEDREAYRSLLDEALDEWYE